MDAEAHDACPGDRQLGGDADWFVMLAAFANPHSDQEGGDTFAKIDTAYLTSIARPAIAFQAALAGVQK